MKHILIVDDSITILQVVTDTLKKVYTVTSVTSGIQALQFLKRWKPDMIVMDVNMPELDGIETMRLIRLDKSNKNIPIIFLTSNTASDIETKCLNMGAADFITKPFAPETMRIRLARIFELEEYKEQMEIFIRKKTQQVEMITEQSIIAIANTIDAKDFYTKGHSVRVSVYVREIAQRLEWSEERIKMIGYAAMLHDIGKVGIPDSILCKPFKLSQDEYEIIKKHTLIGAEILQEVTMIPDVAEGAKYHHEWYNGNGYTYGVKGKDIPMIARIIGVADAYDAMSTDRSYRKKLGVEKIEEEMLRGSGTQFDPEIVRVLLQLLREGVLQKNKLETNARIYQDMTGENSILLKKVLNVYTREMKNKTETDSLTGLFNRSITEKKIDEYLHSIKMAGALFIIDLDEFKRFNDSFGHIMGDELLKVTARVLKEITYDSGFAGRIGGDEFICFFEAITDEEECSKKAELILSSLKEQLAKINESNVVSASIGIAAAPADGTNFVSLYQNADKSLYVVKNKGKNNYCFYGERLGELGSIDTNTDLTIIHKWFGEYDKKVLYQAEYNGFEKIYQFVSQCIDKTNQQIEMLLFSLTDHKGTSLSPEVLHEVYERLGMAIRYSLRIGDVFTEYSSSQYLVILIDATYDNGKMVAERVIAEFGNCWNISSVQLHYDLQEIKTI